MNKDLAQHRQAAVQWGVQSLLTSGYSLNNASFETLQDTPWSYVIRILTSEGLVYLKQTPQQLALEADIIQVLQHEFDAPVPHVISSNPTLNCFLMKDAGNTLRSVLKKQFDEALICKAVDQFTATQRNIADRVEILIEMGIPDWRLNQLPGLYQMLISKKELLLEDGLSDIDIKQLKTLVTRVSSLCEKLSGYAIKQSIVQPDFNDNNTLVSDSQAITMIDLGELSISHPFFPLHNFLLQMKKHHGLFENDERHLKIKEAYLSNYMHDETKQRVLEAFSMTQELFPVYCALSDERLLNACDKNLLRLLFPEQAKPGKPLKAFLLLSRRTFQRY